MMLFGIPLLEWVGYVGSVLVAVSLTMSSIKKLRWYNLVGAAVFSFYGFMIESLPVGLLNLFIVLTNIYYLFRMYGRKDDFKLIRVTRNDAFFHYFLNYHKAEIAKFFPGFDLSKYNEKDDILTVLLLRNADVAGVFSGEVKADTLHVELDFVTAAYRDLKPGQFVYKESVSFFKDAGIKSFHALSKHPQHQQYLLKMGFHQMPDNQEQFVNKI